MYVQLTDSMIQLNYNQPKERMRSITMTQLGNIQKNSVMRAIAEELRKKGLIYDQSISTLLIKDEDLTYQPYLELDSIIDDEAIFRLNEEFCADEVIASIESHLELRDVLRFRALLEEIYGEPISSIVCFSDLEELEIYKDHAIMKQKIDESLEELIRMTREVSK